MNEGTSRGAVEETDFARTLNQTGLRLDRLDSLAPQVTRSRDGLIPLFGVTGVPGEAGKFAIGAKLRRVHAIERV
jgi:hypothetical protein